MVKTQHQPLTSTLTDQDDHVLIGYVADGSAEALGVLYDRHSPIVLSFAMRLIGDRQHAEEILQEVFLKTWRQAGRFRHERGAFVTWLLSITHNLAIDEIRKRNRRPQKAQAADPELLLANVTSDEPSIEMSVEMGMIRSTIIGALNELPDSQRLAIELAYTRGLTQREIAEHLGEPLGTIKTRMRLGMRKMREYLNAREVDLA